jgi:hypothetical protein
VVFQCVQGHMHMLGISGMFVFKLLCYSLVYSLVCVSTLSVHRGVNLSLRGLALWWFGQAMVWSWSGHGLVMVRSWFGHGMVRPWFGHGQAMAWSWSGHGPLVGVQRSTFHTT